MSRSRPTRSPIFAVLVLGLIAAACGGASATPVRPAPTGESMAQATVEPLPTAPSVGTLSADASRFGLDYVFPHDPIYFEKPYAERFAAAGLVWVNFHDVKWTLLEPQPPVQGKHRYVWDTLDANVRHWQDNGFQIAMTLRMGNGWFAGPIDANTDAEGIPLGIRLALNASDRLPKPDHRDDYRDWLSALVERYDGDGNADMPGLLRPILHYQIGNEYGNLAFWTGSVDDYFELLETAVQAIHGAEPRAQVIPNGLRMNDVFHDDPQALNGEETVARFLTTIPEAYQDLVQRSYELNERTLLLPLGTFDVVDAGSNGSLHTVSSGNYAYVSGLLSRAGNEVPIWDMEARSEPVLTPPEHTYLHTELVVPNGKQIVRMLERESHPRHEEVVRWYRAEQARILAKVFVTRFAAGFERVFMGMPVDWNKGFSGLVWPNPYMGLLDPDGNPWPAYDTLMMLVEVLDRFGGAMRLPAPEDVRLYRFDFDDGREPVWVVWLEDSVPRGLDDALPARRVTLEGISIGTAKQIPATGDAEVVPFAQSGAGCSLVVSATPIILSR